MIELNKKCVLHIPLYKYIDDELILIEIDDLLDDLISQLDVESLYITKVKSVYKKRIYDEILITIFSDDDAPVMDFRRWFVQNNNQLEQESFAYEIGDRMIVEKIM